jgi:hypothetical protein
MKMLSYVEASFGTYHHLVFLKACRSSYVLQYLHSYVSLTATGFISHYLVM